VRPLREQTILITGATDGLGKGVAIELARAGATLLLHGRDEARGQLAIHEIREQTGNDHLSFYRADFASITDVRAMGERLAGELTRLDVLVNNAGVGSNLPGGGQRLESHDGYELRFQVNYLAGFMLTRLLLPLLESSAPSRVVNVSSAGQTPIDFDDVMIEHDYSGFRGYAQRASLRR
jgi:NAD(P)-dependent dehydrogenase (short-subunit alcohol dehydrogenase family)